MLIAQILTMKGHSVVTVSPEDNVAHLLATLSEHSIGAVVVSTDGKAVEGIVSERDIVRAMAADPDAGRTGGVRPRRVSSIMSTDVSVITPQATVDDVMALMTSQRVRHVPVVDDEVLVGIVSIGDIVKARLNHLEEEKLALMNYVTHGG
ncbi:MAG: CBS domain-containing protein [Candidatus Nanopelagicales bacterium]